MLIRPESIPGTPHSLNSRAVHGFRETHNPKEPCSAFRREKAPISYDGSCGVLVVVLLRYNCFDLFQLALFEYRARGDLNYVSESD
jgi:hypothetical protein